MRLSLLLIIPLIVVLSSPAFCQGQFFLGATGGVSSTMLSGDAPSGASYTSLIGFSGGIIGEYAITSSIRLSVQPSYLRRGTGVAYDIGEKDLRDSLELRLDYVSIPVIVRFMSPKGAWFVNGGLDLGFLLKASLSDVNTGTKLDAKQYVSSVDLAMIVGVGTIVAVTPAFLTFEIRYAQSLLNAGANDQLAAAVGVPVRFRSSGIQLVVGALLPL